MSVTIDTLKTGQKGIIEGFEQNHIPLKLVEMGCLPGNEVELLRIAPLKCPLYLNVNGTHMAIRKEIARHIRVHKLKK